MPVRNIPTAVRVLTCASLVLALALPLTARAETADQAYSSATLSRLMKVSSSTPLVHISPVRKAALQAAARTLGAQTGLVERAHEIGRAIDAKSAMLGQTFRFGDLVIGAGVLPPVIVKTVRPSAVTDDALRIAGSLYKLVQPARFFSGAPSWRDWLLLGLPVDAPMPDAPTNPQLLPQNDKERAYWDEEVKQAYLGGRAQAQQIFEDNLAQLERVYLGMRTFYDLYKRHMVTAPIIAKSQEILTHDDPNTIIVGDTLFRITVPAKFTTDPDNWVALAAPPDTETALPVVAGYDPAQVAYAYQVYQSEQAALKKQGAKAKPDDKSEGRAVAGTRPATPPANAYRVTGVADPAAQSLPAAPGPVPGTDVQSGVPGAGTVAGGFHPEPNPLAVPLFHVAGGR